MCDCSSICVWKSQDNCQHSVYLLHGFQDTNTGCQAWQHMPLPTEPSHQAPLVYLRNIKANAKAGTWLTTIIPAIQKRKETP